MFSRCLHVGRKVSLIAKLNNFLHQLVGHYPQHDFFSNLICFPKIQQSTCRVALFITIRSSSNPTDGGQRGCGGGWALGTSRTDANPVRGGSATGRAKTVGYWSILTLVISVADVFDNISTGSHCHTSSFICLNLSWKLWRYEVPIYISHETQASCFSDFSGDSEAFNVPRFPSL